MRSRRSQIIGAIFTILIIGIAIAALNRKLSGLAERNRVLTSQHQLDFSTEINIAQQGLAHKFESISYTKRQKTENTQAVTHKSNETKFTQLAFAHSSIRPLNRLPRPSANLSLEGAPNSLDLETPSSTSPEPENFSVSGKVLIFGDLPSERILPLDPRCATSYEREYPGAAATTRFFVTEDGGLGDVFVTILGIDSNSTGPQQAAHRITAKGCWFSPYISACQTGQTIQFINEDDTLHSVINTPMFSDNSPFTAALLPGQKSFATTFDEAEEFLRFKCDTHPWMFAYVNIVDHPYFTITSPSGDYSIPDLPAGNYQIKAHHRKAGEIIQNLEITDSNTAIDFEFVFSAED